MHSDPLWKTKTTTRYAPLDRNLVVDVAIVGAGITGLTLALRLKEVGLRVAVVDTRSVGAGATGHSTGHLTAALDVDYATLLRRFGPLGTLEVATKSRDAIRFIEETVAEHRIDCDFRRADGWRYAGTSAGAEGFAAELTAARDAGIPVEIVESGPLPFMGRSLRFPAQAMFNPTAYVGALARLVAQGGDHVFEDTQVVRIVDGEPCRVETASFVIEAESVIEATHVPIGVSLPLQARVAPYMSYVIAARIDGPLPADLYWDTERPYHYLRCAIAPDGTPVLVAGGEDHKVGQEPDPEARFAALERYVRERFSVISVDWRWSFEVFEPVDGLPYFGRLGMNRRVYAATGFAGTGLTFGTAAALDIADQLCAPEVAVSVFGSRRFKPLASARNFLLENGNVAWRLVRDQLTRVAEGIDLQPGEGALARVDGERVAASRTPGGRLMMVSPVCTHLGGLVQWNKTASTWDCPLHGSRFLPNGDVLSGPACTALPPSAHLEPGREPSVSELVAEWQEQGYTCDLHTDAEGALSCRDPNHSGQVNPGSIEAFHRFEGTSDPGDMCVVIALRIPREGDAACRGVVVLGSGPSASPEERNALARLEFAPDSRTGGAPAPRAAE